MLLTCCWVAFSAISCRPRVETKPVLLGDVRIAGKVTSGIISWQPGEDQARLYYVVTPALVSRLFSLALENRELLAEIKKLQAKEN